MANKNINDLSSATTPLNDADLFEVLQGGVNKKVAKSNLGVYLVYTALLSQSSTNAPVATVKQNTLGGTVVWSYGGVGYYQATLAGAFPSGRTLCFITSSNQNTDIAVDVEDGVPNSIAIYTTVDGVPTNGRLFNASIRIEVYPT